VRFDQQLVAARGRFGWTQAELARFLDMSTEWVSKCERGIGSPSAISREGALARLRMRPEAEADLLYPMLLKRCAALRERFGEPREIPLTVYETDHDLATLIPEDRGTWTAAQHRQVMEILVTRLGLAGYRVRLATLHAATYRRWLASKKLTNTAAQRAAFIIQQTAP